MTLGRPVVPDGLPQTLAHKQGSMSMALACFWCVHTKRSQKPPSCCRLPEMCRAPQDGTQQAL